MTTILAKLIATMVSEKLFTKLILIGLKKLAKSTKTDVDDQLVAAFEKAVSE